MEPIIDVVELMPKRVTLAKAEPIDSSNLKSDQVFEIFDDKPFRVVGYRPSKNGHYHCTLAKPEDAPSDSPLVAKHPQLGSEVEVFGGHFVGFPEDMDVVRNDGTWLKSTDSQQAGALPDNKKLFLPKGSSLLIVDAVPAKNKHVKIELAHARKGETDWYVFNADGHIELNGFEVGNMPKDNVDMSTGKPLVIPVKEDRRNPWSGKQIKLPGFKPVYLSAPIHPGGHFTWGEATHGGSRIPANPNVVYGIKKVAEAMEQVRDKLGGKPIRINSWYRDPATNRRVGGATRSRHLTGDAVDFVCPGIHPYDIYDRLNGWWGSRGGLASATVFTHIDCRGHRSRWSYGF